jgi:hypothetical protein
MTDPKPTPLSPAAQAGDDATRNTWFIRDFPRPIAAAALRAVAEQVVPEQGHTLPIHIPSAEWLRFDERKKIRAEILAIAAGLEAPSA